MADLGRQSEVHGESGSKKIISKTASLSNPVQASEEDIQESIVRSTPDKPDTVILNGVK